VTAAEPDVDRDTFRTLMAGFPAGVAVVTVLDGDGRPRGMTCSSLCSVSLEPPTLLVCLRHGSPTLAAVRDRGRFAVNLLHHRARATAELFASGAADRFDRVPWLADDGRAGPHLSGDAHSVADCVVSGTERIGDHEVVFGRVRRIDRFAGPAPLLYGLRGYAGWPDRSATGEALGTGRAPERCVMTTEVPAPGARRAAAAIFNAAVAAPAIAAAWELGALDELKEFGRLEIPAFAARHDLHLGSTRGMFVALAGVEVVRRDGDTVVPGPVFDEVDQAKPLFHWLAVGSAPLFARMPFVLRNANRVGDYYTRDARAISFASRQANTTFFDPVFWSVVEGLDFPVTSVADLGSGSGERLLQLAKRYPAAKGIGVEIAAPALELSTGEAAQAGLADRVRFVEADARHLTPRPEFADVELLTCFMMGHDFWPREQCVAALRRLREAFPAARKLVLGDNVRTVGVPDDDIPVFTLAFELGHAMMGAFLPTEQEWLDAFGDGGWECSAVHHVEGLAGAVVFELS
jgi:flavin reductase (DIM6/NTAB) family NADH-FMN oxidoreductase RutF/SAM-dependent methyltransferase